MNNEEQIDKIKGSLFGLVWGDVLGCPVETWKDYQIKDVYGKYSGLPESFDFEKMGKVNEKFVNRVRPLGLHSDDGQQALALLNVCLSNGIFIHEKWSRMLVNGIDKQAWRGTGQYFDNAVKKLKMGVRFEMSGSH